MGSRWNHQGRRLNLVGPNRGGREVRRRSERTTRDLELRDEKGGKIKKHIPLNHNLQIERRESTEWMRDRVRKGV
jgi:hypothetical protein